MFDLNKTPTLVEEEVNPQDSGTEKELQIQANSATSAAPKALTSSSRNYPFDSSELAALFIMVQDLPTDHPSAPNLISNSNHACLPPHTSAFSEAPATVGRSSGSAVPKHLAMVPSAPGDGAPAVPDVKHGRVVEVWSRNGAGGGLGANPNQALQCQTTMDVDCHVVSDGESDCCKPRYSRGNSTSKAVLVDLDTLPDPSPLELQFPWSPVHQGEAPLRTPTSKWSSENLQVSATKLTPKELQEEHHLREVAFDAAFKLETQRCSPTAPCRSCLAFCQKALPLPSSQEGGGTGGGLQLCGECPPVLRNVVDDEAGQARKTARHGPKSKSSEYRGVTFYKRTGRWEAHIWHEGAQVYLGASVTKEEAARAYDQAALMLCGPDVDINFKPESYQLEMAYLYKLSKEQLVIYLRRDSRGLGAQASYPGVKHVKNLYQALYGPNLLGTFATEEDAARAVYKEAVRNSFGALTRLILDTHHVRNMPSYAAQRFAALYPEGGEDTLLRNQAQASTSKRPSVPQRPSNSTSPPRKKKRSIRIAPKPNHDSTSPPPAARASAAPPHPGAAEQLPGIEASRVSAFQGLRFTNEPAIARTADIYKRAQINENIEGSPGALTLTGSWGSYLAPRTRYRHAACINLMAAQPRLSHTHQPGNRTNTPAPQQSTKLRNLLPKLVRAPAATTASSRWHAASGPSIPRSTSTPAPQQSTKLRNLLPKFVRGPAATTASSSNYAASGPSIPRSTGEASSSGVIKFKLFNVEISVAVEPGHGGDRTEAHGESETKLCNQLVLPPRKRSKIMGAAAPATLKPNPKRLCKTCSLAQARPCKAALAEV